MAPDLELQNILIIHFGQLGDVVLGLPALKALREHFSDKNLTLLVGKSAAEVAKLAEVADEYMVVDRVALRDGGKFGSVRKIFALVGEVRRRDFDLVIDLHSLSETNLLGYLAGIPLRLYARRKGRSLDILSNFPIKPPVGDRSRHAASRYMDVITPLNIFGDPVLNLTPHTADLDEVSEIFDTHGIGGRKLVGMFLGAGHESRRWPLEKFAALARKLVEHRDLSVVVFLGPEEWDLIPMVREQFPSSAVILDKLKLLPLFAALSRLSVLVSNDTGPTHLAAATQASIVLITGAEAPTEFLPLSERLTIINSGPIHEIGVEEVYAAAVSGSGDDTNVMA